MSEHNSRLNWRIAGAFGVAGVVLGVVIGAIRSHGVVAVGQVGAPTATLETDLSRPAPIAFRPPVTGLTVADRIALRDMVREEVRAARTTVDSQNADAPSRSTDPTEAVEQLTDDSRRAYEKARSLVADSIERGLWTVENRDHLRDSLVQLPEELRLAVIQPLVVAFNSDKVRFQGSGPVF